MTVLLSFDSKMSAIFQLNQMLTEGRRLNPKAPIFTPDFGRICLTILLSGSVQYLAITAIPLFLLQLGFGAGVVGGFVGGFAIIALAVRFPVGSAVDRFGSRVFVWGGAGLLGGACILYAFIALAPVQTSFVTVVPFLLLIAGIAHSVGFSIYGTSAHSFVAYTVPATRRGEAVSYYGILLNVARGVGAGLSLLIVGVWRFPTLFGIVAILALFASILSFEENVLINPILVTAFLIAKHPNVHDDGFNQTHSSSWTPEDVWLEQ